MIPYHGTPVGGKREDVSRFLNGRHCLIPFGRHEDIGTASEVCQSFVIDNGAFSTWRSGKTIEDWSGYYDFVSEWKTHPAFDWAIIPDVIDGSEFDNDFLVSEWPHGDSGVPVWHLHESMQRLEFLMMYHHRIAIGSSGKYSSPGTESWWGRINEAMEVLCDNSGRPKVKIHGLRMLDSDIFTRIPLSSADSTNAVRNGTRKASQCGCNTLTGMTIIAENHIESRQSASLWKPCDSQKKLWVME